jgi:excinuclease UvrABC nuclease subunit
VTGTGLDVLRAAAAGAPGETGVHLFLDDNRDVLYVGKAGNLRRRPRPRDPRRRR